MLQSLRECLHDMGMVWHPEASACHGTVWHCVGARHHEGVLLFSSKFEYRSTYLCTSLDTWLFASRFQRVISPALGVQSLLMKTLFSVTVMRMI